MDNLPPPPAAPSLDALPPAAPAPAAAAADDAAHEEYVNRTADNAVQEVLVEQAIHHIDELTVHLMQTQHLEFEDAHNMAIAMIASQEQQAKQKKHELQVLQLLSQERGQDAKRKHFVAELNESGKKYKLEAETETQQKKNKIRPYFVPLFRVIGGVETDDPPEKKELIAKLKTFFEGPDDKLELSESQYDMLTNIIDNPRQNGLRPLNGVSAEDIHAHFQDLLKIEYASDNDYNYDSAGGNKRTRSCRRKNRKTMKRRAKKTTRRRCRRNCFSK